MSRFRPSTAAQQSQYGEPITLAILGTLGAGAGLWSSFKNKENAELSAQSAMQQAQAALLLQQQEAIEAEKTAKRRMNLIKWGAVAVIGTAVTIFTVRYVLSED
jgi:uncharacterized protein GlcG (DUF336 family)